MTDWQEEPGKKYVPSREHGLKYFVVQGAARVWVYPDCPNPADYVHQSASLRELEQGYFGFMGYGGASLKFELVPNQRLVEGPGVKYESDSVLVLRAPWHSNSEEMYQDTGIDIRDGSLTYVVVSEGHEPLPYSMWGKLTYVLYQDPDGGIVGPFGRGDGIAGSWAQKLGKAVYRVSISMGGGVGGWVPYYRWIKKGDQS